MPGLAPMPGGMPGMPGAPRAKQQQHNRQQARTRIPVRHVCWQRGEGRRCHLVAVASDDWDGLLLRLPPSCTQGCPFIRQLRVGPARTAS